MEVLSLVLLALFVIGLFTALVVAAARTERARPYMD